MKADASGQACSGSRDGNQLAVDDLRQFQTIVEAIKSAVLIYQGDTICYANPHTESLTGYCSDELLAMPFWAFAHPDFQDMVQQRGRARQAGESVPDNYDFMFVRKDGEVRWVNWRASVIEINGETAVMGVGEDITAHKQTEERLRTIARFSERGLGDNFFRALVQSTASVLGVKIVFVAELISTRPARARSLALWLGDKLSENIEWSMSCTPCEEIAKGKYVFFTDAVQSTFPDDVWLRKVGAQSYLGIPITDNNSDVIGLMGIMDDKPILEPEHYEKMMRIFADRSAAELQRKQAETWANQTSEILEMIATDQRASDIYDAIAWMCEARHPGMRCSMLLLKGDKLMHAGAPSLPQAYCEAVNGLKNGPNIGSCGASTYTGKRVLVEDIATDPKWATLKSVAMPYGLRSCWSEPIKRADGHVLGAFGMYYNHPALPDKQELSDLESAARLAGIVMEREQRDESMRKLSSAIEQAGESVVITNRNGIIEYVNPSFTQLTGYSAEEAIGQTPRLLNSGNQSASFYEDMWKTISSGEVWHGKVIDRKKNGSFFPASLTISPVFTQPEGTTGHTHYVGIQSDLTRLEDMEHQFHQAQKMEAIGTLVGGIAHDFNNMLAGMTGNLYLAKKRIRDMPEVIQKLDNVEELSMRSADMIQQLLTFARKDRVSIKPIPFTPFIKETLKLLHASVPENIALHEEIYSAALQVKGDSTLLHQVLMNLITNARDAVENVENPRIIVRLDSVHADQSFIGTDSEFAATNYAHLSVEDNGCGIPKKQLEHLFEPFFTTKEQGKGTGLGLAMVFGAVKTHQGFVNVDSREGEGSTFHIYLPLLKREAGGSDLCEDKEVSVQGQGEMILFADDQKQVLETGKEVLESLGYQVRTAINGRQAVELFEAHAGEIDLCILDIIMPVMDGTKAAELVRQIKPHAKIIFSTGYDKLNRSDMAHETVISKPFPVEKLSRLIRQQLDH